ncbi:hypothetical protein MLD38_012877 [Melastoma candidum]|uniref:Uncharacterized protein n=1 Tax=Melastoma candidum TaxID=119954 RepID=A0ACB9R8C2_9MYRT|nr:hypothetical protein MLD38_012877 [Melastoma candidum]
MFPSGVSTKCLVPKAQQDRLMRKQLGGSPGIKGVNSSIFAYEQTSSGKTYIMSGITSWGKCQDQGRAQTIVLPHVRIVHDKGLKLKGVEQRKGDAGEENTKEVVEEGNGGAGVEAEEPAGGEEAVDSTQLRVQDWFIFL